MVSSIPCLREGNAVGAQIFQYSGSDSKREEQLLHVGSPFGIGISMDKGASTEIKLTNYAKLELVSACLDTLDVDFGYVKLLIRIRNDNIPNEDFPWLCLCNYLGKGKGGGALAPNMQLGLKAAGPCIIELKAESCGNFLGRINVFGNVMASDGNISSICNQNLTQHPLHGYSKGADKPSRRLGPMATKKHKVSHLMCRVSKLSTIWPLMGVLLISLLGNGGGDGGSGVTTALRNRKIRGSPQKKTINPPVGARPEEVGPNQTPRSLQETTIPTWPPFTSYPTQSPVVPCEYPDPETCGCADVTQADYRGSISKTETGIECQRWDAQFPHAHYYEPGTFSDSGLDSNFCRNPAPYFGYDRAWCYTMDPDVEWAYCDIPTCSPPPTVSPRPSSSPAPSTLPTTTQEPSTSPSTSSSPTMSLSPSSKPSSSPTFTGGCMDLSVAILLPPMTFNSLSLTWWLRTTRDEEVVIWEMPYVMELGDSRANSILVEHANGTNSRNEPFCLPEGTFSFEMSIFEVTICPSSGGPCFPSGTVMWGDGIGVNHTWYVLSSSDERIACGDLLHGQSMPFSLPPVEGDHNDSCGSLREAASVGAELIPFQCYYRAFDSYEVDQFSGSLDKKIDREAWFDEECGPILADACKTRDEKRNAVGLADTMNDFCAYHQCAYTSVHDNQCECLFLRWDCIYGIGCDRFRSQALGCCDINNDSCKCLLKPECDDGNGQSCAGFAATCCIDDECKCDYYRESCTSILQYAVENGTDFSFSDLVNGEILSECLEAEKYCCNGAGEVGWATVGGPVYSTIEPSSCGCDFWETLCSGYTSPVCDFAAERCCGSPNYAHPQCFCDFYSYADSLGYQLENNVCQRTDALDSISDPDEEGSFLVNIYPLLGGDAWLNNTGWLSELSHCQWFGISCNNDGLISGIDLSSNNLAGSFPFDTTSTFWTVFNKLTSLNLANNSISGSVSYNGLYQLRNLDHIDISENSLSGEVDVLMSPSLQYLNLSHNALSSTSRFQKFKPSHRTLRTLDLSHNSIGQSVMEIFKDIPPNLQGLLLTENHIQGMLPNPIPFLEDMRTFLMNSNQLSGPIPDISRSFPSIKVLNLSNQTHRFVDRRRAETPGLSGSIPASWSSLRDLDYLDLSYNKLTGAIPPGICKLPQLRVLNVSNNELSGQYIPTKLGELAGVLDVFDASNNMLMGLIPSSVGSMKDTLILLSGNNNIAKPAPLSLCGIHGFDLKNESALCPLERNVLKVFYDSTKGQEYTDSKDWLSEYISHCSWHGVLCNEINSTIELNLTHNGLSGKLDSSISDLHSLEILDLSDNDIKGTIPTELGLLSNLTHLRLSYNAFVETVPTELSNLQYLTLLHLHGNRLEGEMPDLNVQGLQETSSFISDCGLPTDFEDPFICSACTMCCNSRGECHETEPPKLKQVDKPGFESYEDFIWIFFLLFLAFVCVVVVSSFTYDRYWKPSLSRSLVEEKKYALDTVGADSVYSFFLGNSRIGWIVALAVLIVQVLALIMFVQAAVKDFGNDRSDFIYSWKCPRNSIDCTDESDLNWQGWAIFFILVLAHVLKDIINGLKLLILCGKQRHDYRERLKFFIGGLFLTWVASFTIYTSTVYNTAIARSNTEIIVNAVIILFIIDVDEYFHGAIMAASSFWATSSSAGHNQEGEDDSKDDIGESSSTRITELEQRLQNRDQQLDTCLQDLQRMRQSNEQLETRLSNLERKLMSQWPDLIPQDASFASLF